MRRPHLATRIAVGGALVGAVGLGQGALGQDRDTPAGLRAVIDYSLGIDLDTNEYLDDPSPGTYSAIVNGFDFAILSETRNQSFALNFGTQLRAESDPREDDEDPVFDFEEPQFTLDYSRESASQRLAVTGNFRQRDVDAIEPFFIDLDGDTIIDEAGFNESDGTLTEAGARISLETGRTARVGTTYTFSYQSRTYSDTSDPNLNDRTDYRFSTSTRLQFSRVTTGYVDLSYRNYEYSQGRDLTGQDASFSFGLAHEFSEILVLEASLGYSKFREEETISGLDFVDEGSGPNAFFELARELPGGRIFGNYSRQLIDDTFRNALTFGRSFVLPAYELEANVGVTNLDGGDLEPTFGLFYSRPHRDGVFTASLRRTVTLNTDDDERSLTSALVGYSHAINEVSSLRLGLDYALISTPEDDSGQDDETRATFSATYIHALTQDWDMSVGYSARARSTDTEDAFSNGVFVNVGRRFTLRP